MLLLYEVFASDPTREARTMTVLRKIRTRPSATGRRGARDLDRALRLAPTKASREELLLLLNR